MSRANAQPNSEATDSAPAKLASAEFGRLSGIDQQPDRRIDLGHVLKHAEELRDIVESAEKWGTKPLLQHDSNLSVSKGENRSKRSHHEERFENRWMSSVRMNPFEPKG